MNQIKNQLFFYLKAVLFFLIMFFVGFLFLKLPAISQDFQYHWFADQRPFLNTRNFLNVASNSLFIIVGLWGFILLIIKKDLFKTNGIKSLALFFTMALILTGLGSGYYHLNPSHYTLAFDRIAIAIAFSSFFSFLIAQRIIRQLGIVLCPLFIALGIFSVIYWYQTELLGQGDLRPYLLVQLIPLIALPLICILFRSPTFKDRYLLIAFVGYLGALVLELGDRSIFTLTEHIVSGHTLKHVMAAISSLFLVIYLGNSERLDSEDQ